MPDLDRPDLDDALRIMLRERAGDITDVPAHVTQSPAPRDRRRWPIMLAAAAVVAALAVGVGELRTGRSIAPNPSGDNACTAQLPAAWRHALTGQLILDGRDVDPLAAAPDGSLLVTAHNENGSTDLLLWPKDGPARVVYNFKHYPGTDALGTVTTDGRYVVLPIEGGQGSLADYPRGVIETKNAAVTSVLLLDTTNGTTSELATMSARDLKDATNVIDSAVLHDGHVYWDVRPHDNSRHGRIEDYGIATGKTTVADTGRVDGPTLAARGVRWGSGGVAADLPEPVRRAVPRSAALVTDGDAYAYGRGNAIRWLAADGSSAGPFRPLPHGGVTIAAVAGPVVFFVPNTDGPAPGPELEMLDTRTGARTPLGLIGSERIYPGGGVFAAVLERNPNDYPIVRLDTAKLPELHC